VLSLQHSNRRLGQGLAFGDSAPRVRSWYILSAVLTVIAPTGLAASIQPSPAKLAQDFGFTCLMLSEQEPATSLSIDMRYEEVKAEVSIYRKAYWWTVSGDKDRFPSNETFKNMRSLESERPESQMGFTTAGGWAYSYTLHYVAEERFPDFVYVPDHLVVRRKRADELGSAWQLVGIGECRLQTTKPVR
jgi:hypothetical protein